MSLTYEFDVAPHLRRVRQLRAQRYRRYRELHKYDSRTAILRAVVLGLFLFWALAAYGIYKLL
jgi:hypothetical protein